MRQILEGVAQAAGGTSKLEYCRGCPPLVNDAMVVERTLPAMQHAIGTDNVLRVQPVLAAEDFAYFAREVPAFFYFLGTLKPGTASGSLHTPTLMGDDGAIPIGIGETVNVVLDHLRRAQ
jgi:metal-dependent amidase/aminoacylase/carboxypeptidase family protein